MSLIEQRIADCQATHRRWKESESGRQLQSTAELGSGCAASLEFIDSEMSGRS